MPETWVRSLGGGDPLEEEMAIYSRILSWKIPCREEPGELQSMKSRRLGHDRARISQKKKVFFFSSEVLFCISTPHCLGVKEVGKRRNETVNSTHSGCLSFPIVFVFQNSPLYAFCILGRVFSCKQWKRSYMISLYHLDTHWHS